MQAVDRAIDILFCLSASNTPLSSSEVSRLTGLDRGTSHRLLRALESRDLVWRGEGSGKFSLGPGIMRLSGRALGGFDLRAIARPQMQKLMELTHETVGLALLSDDHFRYIDQVESPEEVRWVLRIGGAGSLHSGSASRAMLAFLPPAQQEEVINKAEFTKVGEVGGPRTKTELGEILAEIRKTGLSFSVRERMPPIAAVAAPIFTYGGRPMGALTIGGPDFRVTREVLQEAAMPLLEATNEISRQLGYEPEESSRLD